MLIHQITDLHVPDDDADPRFAHVFENVRRQLRYIESARPDLLVITGDLSMTDHSETACRWIHDRLPELPVIVIPGNHDDPAMIRQIFGAWPEQMTEASWTLVFLDSSPDELPAGQIDILAAVPETPRALLFVHHPPHLIGAGFMSINQPLRNHETAAKAIAKSSIRHVFCGHYHNVAHERCDGFELYLTPSPAFQIALEKEPFTPEEFQPAVRTIALGSTGLSTELVYV
mgnify:CR=1 FL=1